MNQRLRKTETPSASDYRTASMPTAKLPQTPPPESSSTVNTVEQAILRLNDAARRLAGETGHGHTPRASRLKPLRDISADIQRHSTPHPGVGHARDNDLATHMPDFWPWFQSEAEEENEAMPWSEQSDPLQARHIPGRAEAAHLEVASIRRSRVAEPLVAPARERRKPARHLRLVFTCLLIVAAFALGVDSVLFALAFLHIRPSTTPISQPPILTISLAGSPQLINSATIGQHITLHLRYFTQSSSIYLLHDSNQPIIPINSNMAVIRSDSQGNADVDTIIDDSWLPGLRTIQAEELASGHTATTTLRITTSHTQPSHLYIPTTTIDMGSNSQGVNSFQPLTLSNEGTGTINWSASSNQHWLSLTPTQGTFGQNQVIFIGVQRASLKPGDYQGTITFTSSAADHINVTVTMTVQPLSTNTPILELTPALLSFVASEGGGNPGGQYITLSNPGKQTLNWTLANNSPISSSGAGTPFNPMGQPANWLSLSQSSGSIAPGATTQIAVMVQSQNLPPSTYINTLVFRISAGTTSNTQSVTVSLTMQPPCGLTPNVGSLSFTAIAGQGNPGNQALSLNTTANCPGRVNWQATSSADWLQVTPGSGQITQNAVGAIVTVGVNTQQLKAGTYTGTIAVGVVENQHSQPISSQTVLVTLTVQPPPPPSTPVMAVSPLNLNFSTTQGQTGSQAITITNTASSGSPLHWNTNVSTLASSWLGASPAYGNLLPGQAGQLTVSINTAGISPGTYTGQIILTGTDNSNGNAAGGSPQTIMVNLTVLPPCALQLSSSSLAFTTSQGNDPAPQSLTLTASGNCSWPLSWQTSVAGTASWLTNAQSSGKLTASGQTATLTISPSAASLVPGTYNANVTIAAFDSANNPVQGSPFTLAVSLVATGYNVSGIVDACATTTCPTPTPLANATVNLVNSAGTIIATLTANSQGAFSVTNVAIGSYTITATGTDSSGNQYAGNLPGINVSQNTTGLTVDTYINPPPTPTGT